MDKKLPGRALKVVVKKLLIDQLVFSPLCIFMVLASLHFVKKTDIIFEPKMYLNLRKGKYEDSEQISNYADEQYLKKWCRLYIADLLVWPPAQLINFYFLPTKFRVLFDNFVSLLFDIYTSHVCYNNKKALLPYESHP